MRIVSSFMDDLKIKKEQCHSIYFESSKVQMNFRRFIKDYFNNKKLDEGLYLDFVDKDNSSISPKQFYFLDFECFSVDLKEEKDTSKLMLNLLAHELEHNAEILPGYTEYMALTDRFISQLGISEGDLQVEFQVTEKTIEALLKSLLITIEREEEEHIENNYVRELLISAMLKLNLANKEVFLLLSFPEVDVGYRDYKRTMEFINGLGITTIVLSANPYFIKYPDKDCIFLIDKNGGNYNIPLLVEEIKIFGLAANYDVSEIAKELAYRDFQKDYLLLDPLFKKFLLSNGDKS